MATAAIRLLGMMLRRKLLAVAVHAFPAIIRHFFFLQRRVVRIMAAGAAHARARLAFADALRQRFRLAQSTEPLRLTGRDQVVVNVVR